MSPEMSQRIMLKLKNIEDTISMMTGIGLMATLNDLGRMLVSTSSNGDTTETDAILKVVVKIRDEAKKRENANV